MKQKQALMALGLALSLPAIMGAGDATPPGQAIPDQPAAPAGAQQPNQDPGGATGTALPDNGTPAPPVAPNAPADISAPPPDAANPNTQPVNPNAQPADPNAKPVDPNAQPAPDAGQGVQQPAQPAPGTVPPGAAASPNEANSTQPVFYSPLQEFVSHQVHEIGALGEAMDSFRAAGKNDAVMVMYHMIRDHSLVSGAARNELARKGQVLRPTMLVMQEENITQAWAPEEIVREQIQDHERDVQQTQQLLSQANNPEERSVFQQALNVSQKHLGWLHSLDSGQPVQIGFFGPTTPLSRIAGYREQTAAAPAQRANQRMARARPARHRRHRHMVRRYRSR